MARLLRLRANRPLFLFRTDGIYCGLPTSEGAAKTFQLNTKGYVMDNLMRRLIVSVILTTLCVVNSARGLLAQDGDPTLSAKVDELFQRWDQPDSPGYAVGIIRDGEFVHKRGYGMANLDEGIAITSETVFDVMSVSKCFTSVCVALAMDQGLFSPDDDVRAYVPELRDFGSTITIRHLLTCHSGLRDYWHGMILLGRDVEDAYANQDVLDLILRQKTLIFMPGERWGYSNTDYFLLSLIVERVTGKSFREFATEHLFQPLGMKNTFFDDDPAMAIKHRAVSHGHNGKSFVRLGLNNGSVGPWRLKTTLDDMLRWDTFLRNKLLPGGKYLDAFLQEGSLLGNERCLSAFPDEDYKGLPRMWYTGGGMGFMAHYLRFPAQKQNLSIIAFGNHSTNLGWYEIERVLPEIVDLYLADEIADDPNSKTDEAAWSEGARPVELTKDRVQELASIVGSYRLPWGDFVELVMRDSQLCLHEISAPWISGHVEPLISLGENLFRSAKGYRDFELSFEPRDDSGQKTGNGRGRPAVRIKYKNGDEQRWEPVQFVTHTEEQLQEYVGEYYCADLESVYRVSTWDGKLFVQFNFGRKRLYRPTLGDSFIPVKERFIIPVEFSRDQTGSVTEFKTGFDRTGDLIFTKRSQ